MIWLQANAKHALLAHGVAASRDVADLGRGEHKVFVTHDLGNGSSDLRGNRPLQLLQGSGRSRVIEDEFAELAHGLAANLSKRFLVERVQDQLSDVIFVGVNEELSNNFPQGQIGELSFGSNALLL